MNRLFPASEKLAVEWQGVRYVLSTIRASQDCVRCGEPLDPAFFVYRGLNGRSLCQPCVADIDAARQEEER